MKTPNATSLVIFICNLLLITSIATSQTVTINSVSGTSFCDGDSISVTFTATGFWGHRNAFTLQISDPNGSFSSNFRNLGSIVDTLPGTFTIHTITQGNSSSHFRFRILAAIPYIISADNGNDIVLATKPSVGFNVSMTTGTTGTPITFDAYTDGTASPGTAFWDFGSGANPATATTNATITTDPYDHSITASFSQGVTYSTPGDKVITLTVVNPAGCSNMVSYKKLHIYDCSNPSIPHNATVISSDTTINSSMTCWVNPGVTLKGQGDTIFAEPGSTISSAYQCVIYMKPGSVLISGPGNAVIFGDGASIPPKDKYNTNFSLHCPALDFDYTNAPPNAAHPVDAAVNASEPSLTISPNPTRGIISIQGIPSNNLHISVLNILGETVMELKNPHTSDFTLDLSKFTPGTYYIRFSSANSVVTKAIIKN